MTPEEICADRGLDIAAVKAALMQNSREYKVKVRGDGAEDPTLDFSDDDLRAVNEVIRRTALYGEDEHLKFKAATYIRDDKKGRREVVKAVGGNQFNIFAFNEQLKAVRDGAEKIKQRVIDAATGQPA